MASPSSKNFVYSCDRELTAIAQFSHPLGRLNSSFYDTSAFVPSQHVVLGGKNFLKLLVLNRDQSALTADLNLVDPNPSLRLQLIPRLFNVNTIKCNADLIACGLTNGNVHIFQVAGNGKSKLAYRLDDHKRVVNSMDFVDQDQLFFSGSQDGSIRLWDLRMYSQKPAIKLLASQHSDPVRSVQYSTHLKVRGKLTVLSVHDLGSMCKFDLRFPPSSAVKSILPERKWTFHTGPALSLHIHPELEYVLTGGRDRKVCLWNYSDSIASAKAPDLIMNTYGPVMKIRWNDTPNLDHQSLFHGNNNQEETDGRSSALYNYDFACLYLNDDPTITVYNLARRYVPKEIITTNTRKPIQNFTWARSPTGERRLWSISKANNFVSYNLDCHSDSLVNILRSQENLPVVATAWSEGYANMAFVSQNTEDFDMHQLEQESPSLEDPGSDDGRAEDEKIFINKQSTVSENVNVFSRSFLASLMNLPNSTAYNTTMSPKDKIHSNRHGSLFGSGAKSPSPISSQRQSVTEINSVVSPMRPSLKNTPSQSTIESYALSAAQMQLLISHSAVGARKQWNETTPSVVSLSIPVALADDAAFVSLASEYLISIPDGFSISFVCQVNAQVATSVEKHRDSLVWNLLAAMLDGEHLDEVEPAVIPEIEIEAEKFEATAVEEDLKSICSELDNFVASYNSNSTLTTNYGGPKSNTSTTSMTKALLSTSKDSSNFGDFPLERRKSFKSPRKSDHSAHKDTNKGGHSPEQEDIPFKESIDPASLFISESAEASEAEAPKKTESSTIEEQPHSGFKPALAPVPLKPVRKNASLSDLNGISLGGHLLTNPFASEAKFVNPDFMGEDQSPQSRARRPNMHRGYSFTSPTSFQKIPFTNNLVSERNLGMSNTFGASPGSAGNSSTTDGPHTVTRRKLINQTRMYQYLTNHSSSSVGSLPVPYVDGFNPSHEKSSAPALDRVDESSIKSKEPQMSKLTKAMTQVSITGSSQASETRRPWYSLNLISKALHFAIDEGDLVMAATFVLLFADLYPGRFYREVLSENQCLECLGSYIDALRTKDLYCIAVHVVNVAPKDLKYRLSLYTFKDVDMKFYCCWCQKLLVNEQSKNRFGAASENYGYWYCDECMRKQLNCVYCNEPCKGLTVVVDLVCGHRGHFGCLKEWFIEDHNTACPGGCEK